MAVIARIITSGIGLNNKNRKLFENFIAETKSLKEQHQFVLLPGGFLKFKIQSDWTSIPRVEPEKPENKERTAAIEALKSQALTVFRETFVSRLLRGLKSIAQYLVVGIDGKTTRLKGSPIQFVLVYDLQSGKPLMWTGKTYPNNTIKKNTDNTKKTKPEEKFLIQMPICTHFQKIGGKKVAVFMCNDLAIFNPRDQRWFSPFNDERRDKAGKKLKRQDTKPRGKLRCEFINKTLEFCPAILLHLPHSEGTWDRKFTKLNKWLLKNNSKEVQHFASGIKNATEARLPGTQGGDVVTFTSKGRLDV